MSANNAINLLFGVAGPNKGQGGSYDNILNSLNEMLSKLSDDSSLNPTIEFTASFKKLESSIGTVKKQIADLGHADLGDLDKRVGQQADAFIRLASAMNLVYQGVEALKTQGKIELIDDNLVEKLNNAARQTKTVLTETQKIISNASNEATEKVIANTKAQEEAAKKAEKEKIKAVKEAEKEKIKAAKEAEKEQKRLEKQAQDEQEAMQKERERVIKEYYSRLTKLMAESTRDSNIDIGVSARSNALGVGSNYSYKLDLEKYNKAVDAIRVGQAQGDYDISRDAEARTQSINAFLAAQAAYTEEIESIRERVKDVSSLDPDTAELFKYEAQIEQEAMEKMEKQVRSAQTSWDKLKAKANEYIDRVSYSASRDNKAVDMLTQVRDIATLEGFDDFSNYDLLNKKLAELKNYIESAGLATETFGQKLFKNFNSKLMTAFSTTVIAGLGKAFRDIYPNIRNIDTAMTQLNIVVNQGEQAMKQYGDTISQVAIKVGTSISSLVRSTTTFARLGYTLEESSKLAELTAAYAKVADTDVSEATTAITTIVKAFGVEADDLESLLDRLMYVGQNFPISASELGTGFANAGSSLKAAGNDINEAIALLTAANTEIQDISRASTALRTIVARINRAEADLSELGEDGEGVLTTAKLQEFMSAFGVSVVDTNGELRKTYDILQDLSKVWGDLSSTERASIAEKLAGTRQQNIFFGLMNSFASEAVTVMNQIDEAEGTLAQATEKRINSVQGRLDQIRSTWELISTQLLNSKIVTTGLGTVSNFLQSLAKLGSSPIGRILTTVTTVSAVLLGMKAFFSSDFVKNIKNKFTGPFIDLFNTLTKGQQARKSAIMDLKKLLAERRALIENGASEDLLGIKQKEIDNAKLRLESVKLKYKSVGAEAQRAAALQNIGISAAIAGLTLLLSIINEVSQAWKKAYENYDKQYQVAQKSVETYDEEIDALQDLKNRLEDAKGDRVALANLYDDLNTKIQVSTDLITGESQAYKDANRELAIRIAHEKELRNIAAENAAEAAQRKFETNRIVRSGLMSSFEWLVADADAKTMQQFLSPVSEQTRQSVLTQFGYNPAEATRAQYAEAVYQMLQFMSINNKGKLEFEDVAKYVDYDVIEELTAEQREFIFTTLLTSSEAYNEYLEAQVENTRQGLAKYAAQFKTSLGGEADANEIIGDLTKRGYDISGIIEALNFIQDIDSRVVEAKNNYEDAVKNNPDEITTSYQAFQDVLAEITDKYPELTKYVEAYKTAIEATTSSLAKQKIDALSLLDILEQMQTVFDGLVSVMDKFKPGEIIDLSSLESLLKLEASFAEYNVKISDLLTKTADGYQLNADALEILTQRFVEYYGKQVTDATDDTVQVAVDNLEKARIVLATWYATSQKEANNKTREKALNKEKDLLQQQLDAYKELIDLRKTLLKSYEEELEYQRELQKKQQTVSDLQTKLAIAQLDTSAAGRARTRQLESELKKAQEELDDFNLDHAVDVLTQDLDDQYEEYKKYINSLIQGVEDKLDAIKNATEENEPNYDWIKYYIEKIDAVLTTYKRELSTEIPSSDTPPSKPKYTGEQQHPMTDSYKQHLDDKYNSFIPTEEELLAPNPYATAYLQKNELIKYVDDHASINGFTFSPNVPSSKYYDPRMAQIWESLNEDAKYEIMEYVKQKGIPFRAYHSGGYVEGSSRTSEVYAKLMTGEYVSTPLMIKQFVEKTIPAITGISSYNGTNTFNSPLIEINCDNISQEALPQFRNIVNEAVNEIKKQLDDGVSRAGRMKDVRRLNI